jgi:hypothetical protein
MLNCEVILCVLVLLLEAVVLQFPLQVVKIIKCTLLHVVGLRIGALKICLYARQMIFLDVYEIFGTHTVVFISSRRNGPFDFTTKVWQFINSDIVILAGHVNHVLRS